ncbi:MFS transporter [Halorientalis halophila]|uniref:MFS transporter n=1 Tax=Halorientalis halophila TaxID=3108499 RepID=UPI00300A3522
MFPGLSRVEQHVRKSPLVDDRLGVLVAVGFGWFLLLGVRLVVPTLFPSIRAEFAFSNTVAGSVYTILLSVAALLQLPGGIVADRVGGRSVLTFGAAAGLVGVTLLAIAPAVPVFVLGIVLFGIGTGMYGTPRVTVLSAVYPDRDGTAIGICSAAGNVGTTILPVIAGALAATVAWQFGFAFAIPLFAIGTLLLWLFVPTEAGRSEAGASVREDARAVLAGLVTREVGLATVIMLVMFFTYQGVTAFLPTYLVAMKGLSEQAAATLFGAFFAGGVVAQVVGGNLGDRFGQRRTMALLLAASAATLFALPFVPSTFLLVPAVVAVSVQLGFWPIVFSYTIAALPDEGQASGLGLLRTGYLLLGSLGSTFVGALADADLFDEAFFLLAGLALVATLCCLVLPVPAGKD